MTPLECKEQICEYYSQMRYHPNVTKLIVPFMKDAERHTGIDWKEFAPPMMEADYPDKSWL